MYRSLYLGDIRDDQSDVQQLQTPTLNQRKTSDFLLIQVNKLSAEDRELLCETFNLIEKDLVSNGLRIFL
ncbi:hypothetical protein LOAG_07610, partial [Loa loa]